MTTTKTKVDLIELSQKCKENNMIVPDANGNRFICKLPSQKGNTGFSLYPVPKGEGTGYPSKRGGGKKRRKSRKSKKKALRENHVAKENHIAKVRRQSVEQKNVDAEENEYVMDYYNI